MHMIQTEGTDKIKKSWHKKDKNYQEWRKFILNDEVSNPREGNHCTT